MSKATGIPSISAIPGAWRWLRNKAFMREVNDGSTDDSGEMLSVSHLTGVTPRSEKTVYMFEAESTVGYKLVRRSDLVINTMWAWMGAAGVARQPGIVSPAYGVYRLDQTVVYPAYYDYLIRTSAYVAEMTRFSRGVTSSRLRLYPDEFLRLASPLPPLPEQRAIADFLDSETVRIDALIAKKRRMVELLDERLADAVETLVLGLGESRTEHSTTGWFGQVPAAWKETTLRHLGCEVQTGPFGSQLHAEDYVEGGWPVVNPSNLRDGEIAAIDTMTVDVETRSKLERHVLRPGDIVFGRRGEMGRAGLVREPQAGWLCGTGSLRLRLVHFDLTPGYLKLLLETKALRRYFELVSVGSTMDNLNSEILLGLPCVVPTADEQVAITRRVETLRAHKGRMTAALDRQIDLLTEKRKALITAAVTGELDVPGVAA